MKPIEWLPNGTIRCRDIQLKLAEGLSPAKPIGDERVTLFKPRHMVEEMARALQGLNVRRMLELGMWDGGSAIFFEDYLELERFVGVDVKAQFPFLERYIERHGLADRLRIRGNTSQDDETALEQIFREDFEGAELDLVVDDASHHLVETRNSFEICFPHVRAGGLYIIEDWSWGHIETTKKPDRMPPSPLVFELHLVCGCFGDIIRSLFVNKNFVVVERGEAPLERKRMRLETLYNARGLPLPWRF